MSYKEKNKILYNNDENTIYDIDSLKLGFKKNR